MQLLKIQINHNDLYRYTIIFVSVCFSALVVVYAMLGKYLFMKGNAMLVQYILSFVIANAAFVLITIQFQVFVYSMYMRFSTLNGFVE